MGRNNVEPGGRFRHYLTIAIALAGLAMTGLLFALLWKNRFDIVATNFVLLNWKAILGVPFSCMGAFVVVTMFKQGAEPLEFEGLGFKFRGSAGEVVLWALCFLVLISAIHLLGGNKDPQLYGEQATVAPQAEPEGGNDIFSQQP